MYKLYNLLVLFFIFLTVSCNRIDTEIVKNIDTTIDEPVVYYDSHFVGLVFNEQAQAIQNAFISINNNKVTSTSTGAFILSKTKTNSAGSFVKIQKDGYFDSYEFILNETQSIISLNVTLKTKKVHSQFHSSEDQTIALDNGISVKILSSSFVDGTANPYKGQVTLYVNTNLKAISNMPYLNNTLKSYILEQAKAFQLYAEDQAGNALSIAKPIKIISDDVNKTIGQLDIEKERWQEIQSIEKSKNEVNAQTTSFEPIIIGRPVPKTLIRTKLNAISNIPPVFLKAEIYDAENNSYNSSISQDGLLQFYVPQDKLINIAIKDACGNTNNSLMYKSKSNNKETIPDITLGESSFKRLTSQITTCNDVLSLNDMVYVIYDFDGYKKLSLQPSNTLSHSMSSCLYLKKASYYRGDQKIYSIALDQSVNNENNIFLGSNLFCVPKLSGFIKINDASILLNSDQYKIFRDGSSSNLTITNFNGFVISIDNVTQKGTYNANGIIFNNPAYADCFGKDCDGIVIEVNAIGNLGEIVSLKVKGKLNGLPIDGEFNNKLSN